MGELDPMGGTTRRVWVLGTSCETAPKWVPSQCAIPFCNLTINCSGPGVPIGADPDPGQDPHFGVKSKQ